MTISPLAMRAKKVIDAAWLHGDAYDLSSQAAFALESAQLLQSPEQARRFAELEAMETRLRALLPTEPRSTYGLPNDLAATAAEWGAWEQVAEVLGVELPTDRSVDASVDKLTRLLAPTQALREDDPNRLRHDYRLGRDLPGMGGAR